MIDVRPAVERDVAGMVAVDDVASSGDADRIELLRGAVSDAVVLVAVEDGIVRGYVVVQRRRFFGRDFVELLVVSADHRRRGLGPRLLRAAVACATTSTVFTSTNGSNTPMRALLEAEGWPFSGTLRGLDDGDPEVVHWCARGPGDSSIGGVAN